MWEFRLIEFHITGNYNGSSIFVPELVSLWSRFIANKGHFPTLRIELSPFLFIDGDVCRTSKDVEVWDVGCQSTPHLLWCLEFVFCYWHHVVYVNRSPESITPETWTESGHVAHWLRLVQYSCWNHSVLLFCCGESGIDVWCSIPDSSMSSFCSFERNSPPQSVRMHLSCLSVWRSAHTL